MKERKLRNLIQCACGCGQNLISVDKKGRDRKFIHGHNARSKHWYWPEASKEKLSATLVGAKQGEENPHWKGGRYKDRWSYIWVLQPDHPYATKAGYVREHRLVLEQKLGRFLTPEETPHHINGIKDDNRPENLELYPSHSAHLKEGHFAKNKH